jgi:HEAT repeat protein
MKTIRTLIFSLLLAFSSTSGFAQNQQEKIDSLIVLFKKAHREWNIYARQFIEIGDPAVPALIDMLEDESLNQWSRRIAAMTLNDIHSPLYIESALKLLLDRNEDPVLRNHVTAGLKGHDLSFAASDLWEVYLEDTLHSWFSSNIAHILMTSDTALAYKAYNEIYHANDGYLMRSALMQMVRLRPHESTYWYLKGLQNGDWMTGNLAMDSLVTSGYIVPETLIALFRDPETAEEVKWRITIIFGNRELNESIPFLVNALQDPSWLIHNEAAVGLCRMEGERVISEMKVLTKSNDPRVVKDVKWVIDKIKDNR